MNKFIPVVLLIQLIVVTSTYGQLILNADGPGNTYSLINSKLAPGYEAIEVPDCGHPEFGPHIDEVFDSGLNTNVFRFHIHVNEDDDRCINFDRQRNEIKTYDQSPDSLLGVSGETVQYKWKFKLDAGFQSSPNFTHIHQLKAVGGSEDDMPLITLTTRSGTPDKLELRYAANLTQVTVASTDIAPFKGQWIEVTETVTYGESGSYEIVMNNVATGAQLFSYSNLSLRMWKTDADFIRPKWGIYRSLLSASSLRDEIVLFANFIIEELPEEIITWDGGAGNNLWTSALNWDTNKVPASNNIVVIGGSGTNVSLQGTSTVMQVFVNGGAHLTIQTNSSLVTNGASQNSGLSVADNSTVTNNGNITISNIASLDGIYSEGTVTNNGAITINNVGRHGIYLLGGAFSNSTGSSLIISAVSQSVSGDYISIDDMSGSISTFSNSGSINITMSTGDDGIYINDGCTFSNSSTLQISATSTAVTDESIFVEDYGVFANLSSGTVNINSGKGVGIQTKNNGIVQNNGGTITIASLPDHQIFMDEATTFTNSGIINLTNGDKNGLYVTDKSIFTNAVSGTININGSKNHGIQIDANSESAPASVTNSGAINILNVIVDGIRIQESATMTVNAGGNITISASGDEGIQMDSPSTFTNNGNVSVSNSVNHGLELYSTWTNSGTLTINTSGNNAIYVINSGVITNNSTGTIQVTNATNSCIQIDGNSLSSPAKLNNSGNMTLNNSTGSGIIIQEKGILTNFASGVLNIATPANNGVNANTSAVITNFGYMKVLKTI